MTITSNFPTSKDVIATIPDAPFNQNQTILINGVPMTHRDLMNFLFRATEAQQTKQGVGNSAPTTVGHVPRVTSTGVTTYGLITPVNVGVMPHAKVRYAGNQNCADNAQTFLDFTTVVADTDTIYSALQTKRLTCKTAGLYDVKGNILASGPTTGSFFLEIRLNGTTKIASQSARATASSLTSIQVAADIVLAVNDYLELGLLCLSIGGVTSVDGTTFPLYSPTFSAHWVCP